MAYLQPEDPQGDDVCIFCPKEFPDEDEKRRVLCREGDALLMMNRAPYSNGHLLVIPHQHTCGPALLSDETILQKHRFQLRGAEALLRRVLISA